MDDWWHLIDRAAALREQFPPVSKLLAERPGSPLARREDAAHQKRIHERREARVRAQLAAEEQAVLDAALRWQHKRVA